MKRHESLARPMATQMKLSKIQYFLIMFLEASYGLQEDWANSNSVITFLSKAPITSHPFS